MLEDNIEYANSNDMYVSQYSMSSALNLTDTAPLMEVRLVMGTEVNVKISTRPEFSLVFVREKVEQVFEEEGKTEEAKGNFEDNEELAKEKESTR